MAESPFCPSFEKLQHCSPTELACWLQENLRHHFQSWADHFGHDVAKLGEAGFRNWADTVAQHLNSSRAVELVNGHAAMSTEDFRAAYLGQRSRGVNLARCSASQPGWSHF